ncbi:MAG: glycosyltransferase [Paramuribaculum sp.]|nr:glycosyltransferase [Paramuribaculum sp.]
MLTASLVIHDSPLEQVLEAIECIRRSTVEKIWIVYNGDISKSSLYSDIPGTEFIPADNRGFGAGHNIALRKALEMGSRYHLVMNADISWTGDILLTLINHLDEDSSIGLIAPEIRNSDGSLQYSCRKLPRPLHLLARRFLPRFIIKKQDDNYLLKHIDHTKPINAPYLLGCFMLFRCEALKQVGMFDERFFLYPEDIDLTRRIHSKWKTIYLPEVSIVHSHNRQSYKSIKILIVHLINMMRYFNKWGWLYDPERKKYNSRLK